MINFDNIKNLYGGMAFFEAISNAILFGFGVQEKVKEFIDELVRKGELSESQGVKLVKEWSEKADKSIPELSQSFSDVVSKTLEKMNLPTNNDIERLNSTIDFLSSRLEKLEGIKERKD